MGMARPVVRVSDRVVFDTDEHLVVGLSGTSVRLRADSGVEQVVLAGHLIVAVDFAVVDGTALPAVEPHGLMEALPADALAAAQRWRAHVVEGRDGAGAGSPGGGSTTRRV